LDIGGTSTMSNNVKNINKLNEPKTFWICTWGCQMNEEDSEKLSGGLKPLGYVRTDSKEEADIIIFNTCCVRENAEQKVDGNLGALKKLKKENPNKVIAVTGCMMQQEGMADKIIGKFPFVDIIIGTHNAYKFTEYLGRALGGERPIVEIWDKEADIIEGAPIDRASTIKGFVTIMYGCNNFCTYCIVPHVRGRERSRNSAEIIKEIENMVKEGYKEITLLGQNVNSYGKGLDENINFAELLRRINKVDGIERVKFMTSHPKDLSDEVIDVIAAGDKLCESIHLPVQSGSSRILKKMNRHYTREQYLESIRKIKERIPNGALTTDIIVGFPGESNVEFEATYEFLKGIKLSKMHIFKYSKRTGTKAAEMPFQVDGLIKEERSKKLIELNNALEVEFMEKFIGREMRVLYEEAISGKENTYVGYTENYIKVITESDENLEGKIVPTKLAAVKQENMIGIIE